MTALETAELRAAAARTRLHGTVEALQAKVAPAALARSAAEGGTRALAAGADAARANPGKLAGVAAIIGLVFARKRIAALVRKSRPRETSPDATRSSRETKD